MSKVSDYPYAVSHPHRRRSFFTKQRSSIVGVSKNGEILFYKLTLIWSLFTFNNQVVVITKQLTGYVYHKLDIMPTWTYGRFRDRVPFLIDTLELSPSSTWTRYGNLIILQFNACAMWNLQSFTCHNCNAEFVV